MNENNILIFNCGSSSIKFAILNPKENSKMLNGLVENINQPNCKLVFSYQNNENELLLENANYQLALNEILALILKLELQKNIVAIGHRVVHGGEHFAASVIVDEAIYRKIEQCNDLAPLHNPFNLLGIQIARKTFSNLPQVAVFDTAFHQTMQKKSFLYAIPYNFYQKFKIRRYGFHGTSHQFVASAAANKIGKPIETLSLITAHLGNGCSATAIKNGKSVDTTMGMTPLEGLIMGTRSGDIDPGLHAILAEKLNVDIFEVTKILNKQSGLLGIAGQFDMRALERNARENDELAKLAIDLFCFKLAKSISALSVSLEQIDALIFTGGIGENSTHIRKKTIGNLKILNFFIDEEKNQNHGRKTNGFIEAHNSNKILVIATNEELQIAIETIKLVEKNGS